MTVDDNFNARSSSGHASAKFTPLFLFETAAHRRAINSAGIIASICVQSVREIRRCCDAGPAHEMIFCRELSQ
ncbi:MULTISPECIES: hypothetical protein [unclassified Bradyrhizobium]|uniref:hypothetical protein n=1 Tax=unclassified Bradyrhizobium TaxID=2631580 RepID=UPI00211E8A83|nr:MULTISPECIES: hypothetical protein [unclassified Bradyrhizobium]